MTYGNCPNKLRLLLVDQIKAKKDLDSLLKKGALVRLIKYESKTHLSEKNKKNLYISFSKLIKINRINRKTCSSNL